MRRPRAHGTVVMNAHLELRYFQAVFAADNSLLADVRRQIVGQLTKWDCPEVVDAAVLATHEIIANAVQHGCRHGDDTITLSLECSSHRLRVSVEDPSPTLPRERTTSGVDESGRGLQIVDAIAAQWGSEPLDNGAGKTVWFTLSLDGSP
ncbi:ATP-binding protein [Streptomyces sp. NPDC091292]|uniref:ATP-binding protein n=1 Tax=Streptomyces sp. NPDC091292 TaxID=3365991 RepID=UPI00382DC94E